VQAQAGTELQASTRMVGNGFQDGWWTKLSDTMVGSSFWFHFSKMCFPKGLAKELPEIEEITKCLDLIDCTMVSTISTYKFAARQTNKCIETRPRPALKGPGAGK